jgi:hypothetical protein
MMGLGFGFFVFFFLFFGNFCDVGGFANRPQDGLAIIWLK